MAVEERFIQAGYQGYVAGSGPLDRFSGWVLTGIAATTALIVSNLHSVTPYIAIGALKRWLGAVLLAALAGFMEKAFAFAVESSLTAAYVTRQSLKEVVVTPGAPLDLEKIVAGLTRPLWWPLGAIGRWAWRHGVQDPVWQLRVTVYLFQIQAACLFFEVLFALVAAWALYIGFRA